MLMRSIAPRRGASIIEVVIAMVVAAVVLSLVTAISVRQQRLFTDLADAVALSGRLREAATILPIDLRGASIASRDISEARDTSIELRATIASAVVCDTIDNGLVLAPVDAGPSPYASYLTAVNVGDTAWVLMPPDSVGDWLPFRVETVGNAPQRQCAPAGPHLSDSVRALSRMNIGLSTPPVALRAMIGTAVRVTRPLRYSLYRAGDGAWYLGEKEWNSAATRFNTIQPVSGPFLSAALGGLTLAYLDSIGATIPAPVSDPRTIAAIRLTLRGQTKNVARVIGSAASTGARVDTTVITVLAHNRK
ncbi:MAG TPA: hypothetical protein VF785_25305 [Gemmatimonadaceae bacterium]